MMSKFTPEEIAYFQSQRLGRLSTVSKNGEPHVVPVGFRYNPEHDSIDIGGHNIVPTKKYRDAVRYGRVAFLVDDVFPFFFLNITAPPETSPFPPQGALPI